MCCESMPRISLLAASWNESLSVPKLPACIASLLALRPNPVKLQPVPAVVAKLWNAPETPGNVPNSFSEPVPACGPAGVGLGEEVLNTLPKVLQPGAPATSPLPAAVPV